MYVRGPSVFLPWLWRSAILRWMPSTIFCRLSSTPNSGQARSFAGCSSMAAILGLGSRLCSPEIPLQGLDLLLLRPPVHDHVVLCLDHHLEIYPQWNIDIQQLDLLAASLHISARLTLAHGLPKSRRRYARCSWLEATMAELVRLWMGAGGGMAFTGSAPRGCRIQGAVSGRGLVGEKAQPFIVE